LISGFENSNLCASDFAVFLWIFIEIVPYSVWISIAHVKTIRTVYFSSVCAENLTSKGWRTSRIALIPQSSLMRCCALSLIVGCPDVFAFFEKSFTNRTSLERSALEKENGVYRTQFSWKLAELCHLEGRALGNFVWHFAKWKVPTSQCYPTSA
jgi:hypothetical protein